MDTSWAMAGAALVAELLLKKVSFLQIFLIKIQHHMQHLFSRISK